MFRHGSIRLATLNILPLIARVFAQCYFIDGSPADDTMRPCNPTAQVSPCCATNKAYPDICLSSGLCYAQVPGYGGFIFSDGCTDETGLASACPHFCPDRTNNWNGGSAVHIYNILQCNPGASYCCRAVGDTNNCCENSSAVVTFDIGQLQLSTQPTTVEAGATATVTATVSGIPGNCPNDNTAVVGGVLGGVLGAALLVSLYTIVVVIRRQPKPRQELHGAYGSQVIGTGPASGAHAGYLKQVYPGAEGVPAQELNATREVHEIQGTWAR